LMETFLPFGGSDLANNNWLTRVAGSFAGVQPQIPNIAGKSASGDAMEAKEPPVPPPLSSGRGSGPEPGPKGPQVVNHITYNNNGAANAPSLNDVSSHLTRQYQGVMR